MTLLVPVMLFGWLPASVFFFCRLPARMAAMVVVIGGTLFLPQAGYDIPGLPAYDKATAIALGLIVGGRLSGKRTRQPVTWCRYDLAVVLFSLTPLLSSLSNQLGWYNGLSGMWGRGLLFAVPYITGRVYFRSGESLQELCYGLLIGGLVYMPLCLYEVRMSPQLSNMVYGFFPHSFLQQYRYGGFRPVVFMFHGLMVALWMAVAAVSAFWLWRSGLVRHVKFVPMGILVLCLFLTAVLCKSVNGWFCLLLGVSLYFLLVAWRKKWVLQLLILCVACYPFLRITGVLSPDLLVRYADRVVDTQRVASLAIRLRQEHLFAEKVLNNRPVLGWNQTGRGWPVDAEGAEQVPMIDSLWLILFVVGGGAGLCSFYFAMLIGPWRLLRGLPKHFSGYSRHQITCPLLLSCVVIMFCIDTLVNSMPNQAYLLCAGALLGYSQYCREVKSD